MPEILQGRVFARAGAGLALAVGSTMLSAEQHEQSELMQVSAAERERTIRAVNFSLAVPVEIEPVETTTTTMPTTTTTEAPTTTTTQPPAPVTTEAPPPPPAEISGAPAEWMAAAGIPPENYDEVDYIMSRESGWNPAAISSNRCIGLGQNCPDRNGNYWLDDACPDWQNDPVCQLRRFQEYAYGRYGGWDGAATHSRSSGWW